MALSTLVARSPSELSGGAGGGTAASMFAVLSSDGTVALLAILVFFGNRVQSTTRSSIDSLTLTDWIVARRALASDIVVRVGVSNRTLLPKSHTTFIRQLNSSSGSTRKQPPRIKDKDNPMSDPDIDLSIPVVSAVASVVPMPAPGQYNDDVPAFRFSTSQDLTAEQLNVLRVQGYPAGLAQELGNSKAAYPLRFWVVDNSGSMRANDGHQIRGTKENITVVECNRWTELQGAVEYHIQLAGLLPVTTVFRMLNDPGILTGPQEFSVADPSVPGSFEQQIQVATSVVQKSEPRGVTPLSEHLKEIRKRIENVEEALRAQGQIAVIVLATDGLPSNSQGEATEACKHEFIDALRSLQSLPVWVVVRLCTDDDQVVEYYNNLDSVLELPLEVIDDFFGEGAEIFKANPWLNYALPMHRCREMGYQHRIFDLLDERLLNKDELVIFLKLLFGDQAMASCPDIHDNFQGFFLSLSRVVKDAGKQYNPNTRMTDFWIDMKQLEKNYGGAKKRRGLFGRKR
jgi:hypothetical protein